MDKKGFTLIELLAVLVIMALIITIAVPNVISISHKIKNKMFCDKVNMLITDAKLYGQDNYDLVNEATQKAATDKKNTAFSVSIKTLIDTNYVKKENKNCVVGDATNYCIKDPRDNSSMDNAIIYLYVANNRVAGDYAFSQADANICTTSSSNNG